MLQLKANCNFSVKESEQENEICIQASGDVKDTYFELVYSIDMEITGEEYVLFPACCYKGNQFQSFRKNYPPMFLEEETGVEIENGITDVPRLEKDGSGSIQVTTGDVSVPCVAVYSEKEKKAVFVYTIQEIEGVNLGLSYAHGEIGITYPHMRKEKIYRWPFMKEGKDKGMDFFKGQQITIPYRIVESSCESMEEFYRKFFENRKCMKMDSARAEVVPFDEQVRIQIEKFNIMNWREEAGFYGVGTTDDPGQSWQLGWIGGGMSSYALMKLGGDLEWKRGMRTIEHIFRTQLESGFFIDTCDAAGNEEENATKTPDKWFLTRKAGDALYFLIKDLKLINERKKDIPEIFISGTVKLADALVKLWRTYGQYGQFINRETGEIIVGGSASGALIPGALASAYQFFEKEIYLKIAEESAEMFWEKFALQGYTTGGPEEALQCPDSESAFALLESYIVLHEVTGGEKWLERAIYMVHFCSSWVVAYNYKFPEMSEFGKLGMKTVGSVFANSQNKHSAPGICTLSGDSLYKIYKWTKNPMYLEFAKDVTLTIGQYMSTEQRPIYSWDVPKDASLLNDDSLRAEPEKLPQGFICERVNMSDWESKRCIGGVFNGSCWAETSNLLVLAEAVPLLCEVE